MGYSTDFEGKLQIAPPILDAPFAELQKFIREKFAEKMFHPLIDPHESALYFESGWKTYDFQECLPVLLAELTRLGHSVSGEVVMSGEDPGDIKTVRIVDGRPKYIPWGPRE